MTTPRRPLPRSLRFGLALALALAIAALVALIVVGGSSQTIVPGPKEHDVTAWAPPGAAPLSDSHAAALVTRTPENRPANATANAFVPTDAALAAFHAAQSRARSKGVYNPLTAYVTGRPGIRDPSTDDLIQWVSHKWGIPTDWIRAQLVVESDWRQAQRGDLEGVSARWFRLYPGFSRVSRSSGVYQSLGIAQEKWIPNGSVGAGTEPLRWQSTAFNLDYYAATVRYYYDGDCSWCSSAYRAGQAWKSIGAWYSPQPWGNVAAGRYVAAVKIALDQRPWTRSGF
jgi:hypothetical protein